jgi:hypothetical protein
MLFFIDGNFVEVLRENCYKGILTICGPSKKALINLKSSTMGEPVRILNQQHKWALHVPENQAPNFLSFTMSREVEKVDRITGPALAFAYDFVLQSSIDDEGPTYGDYGYCWPEDIEATHRSLFECDDPASDEVFFVPIWTLPDELTGAPRESLLDIDEDSSDG